MSGFDTEKGPIANGTDFWSAVTSHRVPTARHVSPIKAQTGLRTPRVCGFAAL